MNRQDLKQHIANYYDGKTVSLGTARRLQSLAQFDIHGNQPVHTQHILLRWPQFIFGMAACLALLMSSTSLYLVQTKDVQTIDANSLLPYLVNSHANSNANNNAGLMGNALIPNLVAIKYQIDGCPRSAACEPIFTQLVDKFGDQQVIFTRYDMTSTTTLSQSRNLASVLGVDWAFEGPSQSGMILLIDRETREVLCKLSGREQLPQMEDTLSHALCRIVTKPVP